jgi:hypothetical protein
MDNLMDASQLDDVVHLASYLPFDTIDSQGRLTQDVSILSSTRWANMWNMLWRHCEGKWA